MLQTLRHAADRLLGRGSASIAVPVMDGALQPNRQLDEAEVVAELPGLDDLAVSQGRLLATAGDTLHAWQDGRLQPQQRFGVPITALAAAVDGRVAVALDGAEVRLLGGAEGAVLRQLGQQPLRSVVALAFTADGSLLVGDGSTVHGPADWCRDLMSHGATGRVGLWQPASGQVTLLAERQHYVAGVASDGAGGLLWSESWRHRVQRRAGNGSAAPSPMLAELPGYPSRLVPAAQGGFWVCCFVCRTQLVEFVLREDAYRRRMLADIDPRYWIAPALSSGQSFLEPLQGAGVKQMGVLKPWAPPRSYGLVLHMDAQGRVTRSLHSQVDGRHHGITAVAEHDGALYIASRGSGRLLRLPLDRGACA